MQGRPYVRFLFAENAVGDRPLTTLPTGDVIEDQYPVRPYGRLGHLAFVADDNTNHYEASYLVYMATIAQNSSELTDATEFTSTSFPIFDLENRLVYSYTANLPVPTTGSAATGTWIAQKDPDDPAKDLLPSKAAGIGHLVYDDYHSELWYVQPDGTFILVADHHDVNKQFITAKASEVIEFGQLLFMDTDGRVRPATWDGGKAVGYAMNPGIAGQDIKIQIGGVFSGYNRWNLTPGTVYYQTDNGEIRWPESLEKKYKHPAALALTQDSFIILTEIYIGGDGSGGGGGGGSQTISISGVNVVRRETAKSGYSSNVVPVLNSTDVLDEIFAGENWSNTTYMHKQYVTIKNTDLLQSLQVLITNPSTSTTITELLRADDELTFPIYDTDWEISCHGSWYIHLVTEIIAGILPMHIVTDTSTLPAGTEVYEYTDPTDNTKKYVVLGQIKKFDFDVSGTTVLFDFPQWIADTITSTDYMVIGSVRLVNTSFLSPETIHVMKNNTVLYDFDLAPLEETLIELNREDIKFVVDNPGAVESHVRIQATAYSFNE